MLLMWAVLTRIMTEDPTMPSSRNVYIFVLSNAITTLPLDAHDSPGDFLSFSVGPITAYAKVIGCSLTASNATTVVNGLNHAANGTGEYPEPSPHAWFTATPLPSRGSPHEDLFSSVAAAKSVTVERQLNFTGPLRLSLLEDAIGRAVRSSNTLSFLEGAVRNGTALLYAAIGDLYGYTSISQCVRSTSCDRQIILCIFESCRDLKSKGWDPHPALGVTTTPVQHARLKIVHSLTWLGLIVSLVLFATMVITSGRCPADNVPLCGGMFLGTLQCPVTHPDTTFPALTQIAIYSSSFLCFDVPHYPVLSTMPLRMWKPIT